MNKAESFLQLKNSQLLCDKAYLGGEWVTGESNEFISIENPANGQQIAEVPKLSANQTVKAIAQAAEAQKKWRHTTAREKSNMLQAIADKLLEHKDDLALIMTLEQGKPLAEAAGEIVYAASYLEWFAAEAHRVYGDTIPSTDKDRRIVVIKEPVGVVATITPWNFPSAMIARKLAPALAVGCAMVVKPATQTPLSALAYGKIADMVGLPKGLLSIITGKSTEIGGELASNKLVRKISFTGSTEVGRLLMAQSASTIKRISLELGGNAPFIVFDDADIDEAVEGAIGCKYRNSGQTCVCTNRIYVGSKHYDEFCEKYAAKVKQLKVGDGLQSGVNQGPLIDMAAVEKIKEHIADALAKGGELLCGGKQHSLGGTFFEPTVIANANSKMKVAHEETFGPLAPIFRFEDEEEVVEMANDTEYGLAAYFYSRDIARIWRVAEALEYGMVGINAGVISASQAPFGGIKQSGMGREGSKYGMDDYLSIKYLCFAGLKT